MFQDLGHILHKWLHLDPLLALFANSEPRRPEAAHVLSPHVLFISLVKRILDYYLAPGGMPEFRGCQEGWEPSLDEGLPVMDKWKQRRMREGWSLGVGCRLSEFLFLITCMESRGWMPFLDYCESHERNRIGHLSSLSVSENMVLKRNQKDCFRALTGKTLSKGVASLHFANKYKKIKNNKTLHSSSSFRALVQKIFTIYQLLL